MTEMTLAIGQRATLDAILNQLLPATASPPATEFDVGGKLEARAEREPAFATLIRSGLNAVDRMAGGDGFAGADAARQRSVLEAVQSGAVGDTDWGEVAPAAFFKRIRTEAIGAYYSDPRSWEAPGYPGASMPEGYPDGGPCAPEGGNG